MLMQGHVPLLRSHDLITERPAVQGEAAAGGNLRMGFGGEIARRAGHRRDRGALESDMRSSLFVLAGESP